MLQEEPQESLFPVPLLRPFGPDPIVHQVYLPRLNYVVVISFIQVSTNECLGVLPPILIDPPVRR